MTTTYTVTGIVKATNNPHIITNKEGKAITLRTSARHLNQAEKTNTIIDLWRNSPTWK